MKNSRNNAISARRAEKSRKNSNKAIYESIMRNVSREVKKAINESALFDYDEAVNGRQVWTAESLAQNILDNVDPAAAANFANAFITGQCEGVALEEIGEALEAML